MNGVTRDEDDPHTFLIEWPALYAGLNPWKATNKVAIDPLLVAKAVKAGVRVAFGDRSRPSLDDAPDFLGRLHERSVLERLSGSNCGSAQC